MTRTTPFAQKNAAGALATSLLLLLLLMTACKPRSGGGYQQDDIVGTWRTQEIEVTLVTHRDSKRDSTYQLEPPRTGAGRQLQPPLTFIQADGSYRDEIRDDLGEVVKENKGFWHLTGDTLIMRMEAQQGAEMRFHVLKNGNKLRLTNQVDWDADGKKDDLIRVNLKRE